ncbi:type IV pilus biogenesis protein PilM [Actimicrobium antarcticum]|uniref:Uncharacterized protein n=1 Tax=Actimicrobium antarcticum TaxID=1051899 RepID=A0ABP7TBP4_9BURK
MWIAVIIAMIGSLIGFAAMSSQVELARAGDKSQVTALSENMTSYRAGVINFANANPGAACPAAVPAADFPTGYVALNPPLWSNCIWADGTIVVYATRMPEADIIDAISQMASRSVTAGRINTNTIPSQIETSFHGTDAPAALPALPASITPYQNGRPVWLAHRD